MSEKDYSLVTSKAGTVVAENLKVTLATAGGPAGLSPATITAMVGISQNLSLKIADDVTSVTNYLQSIASSNVAANITANTILSSMTSLQSSLGFGGSPNQGGFGSIISQCVQHCKDSVQLKQATNFLESIDYDKFGSGISDMGSMVERGMSNVVGDLSAAGAAMASTGSMFNGIDVKDFGNPLGFVKALQANKLANFSGVNSALTAAGVPLSDLDNPIYADKINLVLSNIKNPNTINTIIEQFNISPPGGLPPAAPQISRVVQDDTGDWTVYGEAGPEGPTFRVIGSSGRTIYSGPTSDVIVNIDSAIQFGIENPDDPDIDVPFFQNLRTTVENIEGELQNAVMNSSSVQSLADLSDPSKLAEPGSISGFAGSDALAQKFKDLGASTIGNAQVAGNFFGAIQQAATPLMTAANSTLKSLMDDLKPTLDNMIGSGSGLLGTPNVSDFTQHVSGGPAITGFIQAVQAQGGNALAVDTANLTSLQDSITTAQSLFSKAGVDFGSIPSNSLSTAMTFATNLKKFGQDTLTDVAPVLRNMADTSTKWGESVKASLAEGANDKLFALNGMPPLNSNPFQGLPSDPTANPSGDAAKLLGG